MIWMHLRYRCTKKKGPVNMRIEFVEVCTLLAVRSRLKGPVDTPSMNFGDERERLLL